MTEVKTLSIRLPVDLWEQLKKEADKQDRSINAQLVHILKVHFDLINGKQKRKPKP